MASIKKHQETLQTFRDACDELTKLIVAYRGEMDREDSYWIADQYWGVWCVSDDIFLNMGEILTIVELLVPRDELEEWYYGRMDGKYTINLSTYMKSKR